MDQQSILELEDSYNRVAKEYVERIFNELEHKPLDRQLLDRFANSVTGRACDLGCGPGHIARYLRERGVDVCGIDLSPEMVEQARLLNPGTRFEQGNMLSLDVADEALGGIAAFYSIIHIPRAEVVAALSEMKRVLRPEGLLLLSFHIGDEVLHVEDLWGEKVSLDFIFFRPDEMKGYLKSAGFRVEETIERPPYETVEYQSHRAYIFARKPGEPID
ncbi:MAG TPA: class I SAM-dependent methyltransferase [Blastocatellia bacterium]|nr:class I SAM-dependent methyltransferase [Blastocatellia bacterium]